MLTGAATAGEALCSIIADASGDALCSIIADGPADAGLAEPAPPDEQAANVSPSTKVKAGPMGRRRPMADSIGAGMTTPRLWPAREPG